MIQIPKIKEGTPGQFISALFLSRTQAHIYHLQTTSFAAHKALNKFYNGIIDIADSLTESYQGKYGIIKGYDAGSVKEDIDYIKYFESLRTYITSSRYTIFKQSDSELQNIIDEATDLLNTTIYKLKFLK